MPKFRAKVRRQGRVFIVTVPKQMVDNEVLESGTDYWFDAEEATQ